MIKYYTMSYFYNLLQPLIFLDGSTRAAGNTITFKVTGQTGILVPKYGSTFCYHDGTDIRSSGMVATASGAGAVAAQPLYTLPSADGSANQYLKTDGAGAMSFATLPAAGISMGKAIAAAMIFG